LLLLLLSLLLLLLLLLLLSLLLPNMAGLTARWMWDDAWFAKWIPGARDVARLNPYRWSEERAVPAVAAKLRNLVGAEAKRPIRLRVAVDDDRGQAAGTAWKSAQLADGCVEATFDSASAAVAGLQQFYGTTCPEGHMLELFTNDTDKVVCEECGFITSQGACCRPCRRFVCDRCNDKLAAKKKTPAQAPLHFRKMSSLKAGFDLFAKNGYLNIEDENVVRSLARNFGFDKRRLRDQLGLMAFDANGHISFAKLALWADMHLTGVDLGLDLPDRQEWQRGMPKYWTSLPPPSAVLAKRLEPAINLEEDLVTFPPQAFVRITEDAQLTRFQSLLDRTHKSTHNFTRDRQMASGTYDPHTPVPKGYALAGVWRNENAPLWRVYQIHREITRLSLASGEHPWKPWTPATMAVDLPWDDLGFYPDANEWLLFHAGAPNALVAIAQGGFSLTKLGLGGTEGATSGLYGDAIYCTDSITKADEYARVPVKGGPFDGCRTAAVVRVVGGRHFYTDRDVRENEKAAFAKRVLADRYDSTIGDRLKLKNTFREYAVYDASATYLEYVLFYRRKGVPSIHK